MAFRKPITTFGGLKWWSNIKQNEHFIIQKHKAGSFLWPYKYRIILRKNKMEIANSNDYEEIEQDWIYLKKNVVPQIENQIDIGEKLTDLDFVELLNTLLKVYNKMNS